jgi:hypothetical protein
LKNNRLNNNCVLLEHFLNNLSFMNKSIFTLAVIAFFAGRAEGQMTPKSDGPKIEFAEKQHNFGDIREDIKFATHRFMFKNVGNRDLFINTVQTSCGCTTPDWTRDTVKPGESGFVDAKYETVGRIGSFQKTITVYSNAVNFPFVHLDILGNVQKDVVQKEPEFTSPGQITFLPPTVNFKPLFDHKSDTQTFRITNGTPYTTQFSALENLPPFCQVIGMPQTLEPNESAKVKVVLDGRKISTYGFGAFEVAVTSDNALYPYTGFYVAYERKQFFPKMTAKELAKAAKLTTDKTVIDLGSAESGEIFNTQFTFTNAGKSELKLHEITPQCPCVKVDYPKNTLKPGESMVVKMRFDTGIKHGKSTQTISIISNDPAQPERNIYLVAHLPERDKPKCATCPR